MQSLLKADLSNKGGMRDVIDSKGRRTAEL